MFRRASSIKWIYWFSIYPSWWWLNWFSKIVHFCCEFSDTFMDEIPKVQISIEPSSRLIYAEPIHLFERWGSQVLFSTKTFTCVYVNFCSISITINPILCENYTSTKVERILSLAVMYLFYCKIDGSGVTPVNGTWNIKVWFSWVQKYIVCINKA